MSILIMVAVRDRAIDSFGNPFCVTHTGGAIRSFADEINTPDSQLSKHPDDYDLYKVAEYDTDTGKIKPLDPKMIASGKEQVQPRQ